MLSHTQQAARQAMRDFMPLVEELAAKVRRTNGAELITFFTGGEIRFRSTRSNLRGRSADIVFIDWDVEADGHWIELGPIIATSKHGEIVRA